MGWLRFRQPAYDRSLEMGDLLKLDGDGPAQLLGAWKCQCGYKRPGLSACPPVRTGDAQVGNYFGRCPKCLGHPHYIDCPSCGFTMDVR
jgi:hypothetical protein